MKGLIPGPRHPAPCEEMPPPLSRTGGRDLFSLYDSGALFNRENLVYTDRSGIARPFDLRLDYGLGPNKRIDVIEVKWPTTQKKEKFTNLDMTRKSLNLFVETLIC